MEAYEETVESEHPPAPTEALQAFLAALVQRLPDDPNIEPPKNPWAYMPISDEASGPVAILHVVWDSVDTVREVVPPLAREHGLVCYDMQDDALL